MRKTNGFVSLLLLCSALTGCSPTIARPAWFNPGPEGFQRQQAVQFDPYPDQDAGPRVDGGRPLDYDRQIPPVERSRFYQPNNSAQRSPTNWFGRRFGVPAPPINAPDIGGGSKGGPNGAYYPGRY